MLIEVPSEGRRPSIDGDLTELRVLPEAARVWLRATKAGFVSGVMGQLLGSRIFTSETM
jgi:hypothetical protein